MKEEWEPTREEYDVFLGWLDPDRERAGARHEKVRERLRRLFISRGCLAADELVDRTVTRVIRTIQSRAHDYVGEPEPYFLKVAHFILREHQRDPQVPAQPPPDSASPFSEKLHRCLDNCLARLSPEDRELLVGYYDDAERPFDEQRRLLAARRGLSQEALRQKVCRLKHGVAGCVRKCAD
jgi:hypothetical protein